MNFVELKKDFENGKVFSVYLLEGEDAFFREKALDFLKKGLVSEPSVNLVNFSGESLKDINVEAEFFSSVTAFPFMSLKRMSVIKEFYPKQDFIKKLQKLIDDGSLESSAIVFVNEKNSDTIKKLSNVCVVSCDKADATTIARWVKGTCEKDGVLITLQTASLLAEYCLCDMVRVATETEKLISYAFNKKVIEKEDLELLVYRDSEHKIYEMTDYIAKKQVGKALEIIFELQNKGEPKQKLLTSIYYYFRKLLHVAISDLSDAELAKVFNMKDFAVKKLKQQAEKFRKISLKKAVDFLAEADYSFKSGKTDIGNQFYLSLFKILLSN